MNDESLGCFAIIIVVVGIVIAGLLLDSISCGVQGSEMGRETKYRFISGCMVKANDGWVPMKNFRAL